MSWLFRGETRKAWTVAGGNRLTAHHARAIARRGTNGRYAIARADGRSRPPEALEHDRTLRLDSPPGVLPWLRIDGEIRMRVRPDDLGYDASKTDVP